MKNFVLLLPDAEPTGFGVRRFSMHGFDPWVPSIATGGRSP